MAFDTTLYRETAAVALDAVTAHVDASRRGDGPAVTRPPVAEVAGALELERWIREGGMDAPAFATWLGAYLDRTVRLHHPGSLAHQVATPDVPAALADLIHGATNNPMAMYEMGAAAAAVEVAVVDWMLATVGWPGGTGAGVLTHGGSLANLTALLAARGRVAPGAWRDGVPGDLAILAPPSAHYSITRAAAILGLGEAAVVALEVDDLERIRPDRLGAALDRAAAAGRRPMALVAAACATSTGLHDDLRAIGAFCAEHGIWLHADAAHGASALLSPRHRAPLAGLELADSVVWDAHKMLRTSSLCAAVLVRRGEELEGAFRQEAAYLFAGDPGPGPDLITRAVECTKAPLGLKLFLNLAWRGEDGLGEYVAGRYDAARRFAAAVRRRPGLSVPYEPESNIVCFAADGADPLLVREALLEDGAFHLSTTEVAGRRYLRVAIMVPDTGDATLERLLDAVEAAAAAPG
jgi:L-2,4-diaminobutyrate decarboxylase